MTKKAMSLNVRILIFCGLIASLPLAVIAWRSEVGSNDIEQNVVGVYGTFASQLQDVIDRNLFERYGDVQAFSANRVALKKDQWYETDESKSDIVATLNRYVDLYDIYTAMFVVDLKGRPVAVNGRDNTGNRIDTSWIMGMDFSSEQWFMDALAGRFHNGPSTTGTCIEDVSIDPIAQRLQDGVGMALRFAAPVRDDQGETVAVWCNVVSFELVNDICHDFYRMLAESGYPSTEITLMDRQGRVIVDLDPSHNKGVVKANDDKNVLLKLNLAKQGVEAARLAIAGNRGGMSSWHARKKIPQSTGFAQSRGALGYAGLGWAALVRVDEKESLVMIERNRRELIVIIVVALIAAVFGAWRLARSISRPLNDLSRELQTTSESVLRSARILASSSQTAADGASEQAASVEETSSSMEEMSSMTEQNASSVKTALQLVNESSTIVGEMSNSLRALTSSMEQVAAASDETKKIVKTIDEIAFQTNILALNAAVEAARAGNAGSGFAVVADEVRSLAGRAAQAARLTGELIDANTARIDESNDSARSTESGFSKLIEATRQVEEIVHRIASASEQQNAGIAQVNAAVMDISIVTQKNAAGAEEAASAAREVSGLAISVKGVSGRLEAIVTGLREETETGFDATPARRPRTGESPRKGTAAPRLAFDKSIHLN